MTDNNDGPKGPKFPPPSPEGAIIRLLKLIQVHDRTTLSPAAIWRKVKAGTFPAPVKLTNGRVAWYEHEVNAWILNPKV